MMSSAKRKYAAEDEVSCKKHSLDSDEEEENNAKYDILDEDDIEGQENETIDFDGDIRITPFNMKEELEEGHFDTEGNYYFNKKTEEIRDEWLDNIDWIKVKHQSPKEANINKQEIESLDKKAIYSQLLKFLLPGETVNKALHRLGRSVKTVSASQRWLQKKKQLADKPDKEDSSDTKEKFLHFTELINTLVQIGEMEIYSYTYEKISFMLKESSSEKHVASDSLDMFADDGVKPAPEEKANLKSEVAEKNDVLQQEVLWEFKWENSDTAEIYGPHRSLQMLQWSESGYFPDGVWVRKVNHQSTEFLNSKRIDFDLYT